MNGFKVATGTVAGNMRLTVAIKTDETAKTADSEGRTMLWYVLVVVVLWASAQWGFRRSDSVADDWHGWRQSDTQTIARNFVTDGIPILYPRIDWGGAGPGYVETEFQLYPAINAVAMKLVGESERVSQFLSLVYIVTAVIVLYGALRRRFGEGPAWVGIAVMLSGRALVYLSTSVQPDTLGLLLFVVGWTRFLDFVESEQRRPLIEAIVATVLAGLVKTPLLGLGVAQFAAVLIVRPRLFRRLDLWLGWAVTVGTVALFLGHAHSLFVQYGNTFGTVSGGDSKFPTIRQLFMIEPILGLMKMTVWWGTGVIGSMAAVLLVLRRRINAPEVALTIACATMSLVALRYSSNNAGSHYHVVEAVLAAWFVAHVSRDLAEKWPVLRTRMVSAVVVAATVGQYAFFVHQAVQFRGEPPVRIARALIPLVNKGDLIVVRSNLPQMDEFWQTASNFNDPRIFYIAGVHGWPLAADVAGHQAVASLAAAGARYYVEGGPRHNRDVDLDRWLEQHAVKKFVSPSGAIWALSHESVHTAAFDKTEP